jgi:hypothetical protein
MITGTALHSLLLLSKAFSVDDVLPSTVEALPSESSVA